MSLTLRPDGLGDGAGVTQAVRVDRTDNKEIDSVGEESHHRVSLVPHVVRHRLPSAAHWLADGEGEMGEGVIYSKIHLSKYDKTAFGTNHRVRKGMSVFVDGVPTVAHSGIVAHSICWKGIALYWCGKRLVHFPRAQLQQRSVMIHE